jgi:cytochrome c oxidase subunit 2
LPIAAGLMLALSGCSGEDFANGYLPLGSKGATNHTGPITEFWNLSWVVLFIVGFISWGLMAWALIVYRRRKGSNVVPPQLRYNNPIETLFTVVPLILVVGFFVLTAQTMQDIEKPIANPAVKVEVIGKQWAWDFNYVKEDVYSSGIQVQPDQVTKDQTEMPVLHLPVGEPVQLDLSSRDVVHSFWVVEFLYKKDVFPGRWNHEYFTPTKVGTFTGKCTELCGEYHSMMLFQVKVETREEYDAYIQSLRDKGQTGQISIDASRNLNLPGNGSSTGNEGK